MLIYIGKPGYVTTFPDKTTLLASFEDYFREDPAKRELMSEAIDVAIANPARMFDVGDGEDFIAYVRIG